MTTQTPAYFIAQVDDQALHPRWWIVDWSGKRVSYHKYLWQAQDALKALTAERGGDTAQGY